jgi:WRC
MRRRSSPTDAPPLPDDLRCRRSNGKDWRCSEQALPDLSYCAYHHRLNYHRPPPSSSSSSSGRRPSRRKYSSSPALGIDGCNKADLEGDCSAGSIGDGTSFVKRRKRRRKESLMCFEGKNFANLENLRGDG